MVFDATMRSETVGPLARRTRSRAMMASSATQTAPNRLVRFSQISEQVFEGAVDPAPVDSGVTCFEPHTVVLQIVPLPIEVDDLVIDDQRGEHPDSCQLAFGFHLGGHDYHTWS